MPSERQAEDGRVACVCLPYIGYYADRVAGLNVGLSVRQENDDWFRFLLTVVFSVELRDLQSFQ